MTQFVSQYLNYRHGVRDEVPEHLGHDGKMVPKVRPLEAVFARGGLTPEAIAAGKANLNFHGLMEHESGEDLDSVYRLTVFDSEVAKLQEGWTDEEEALVVETLRSSTENGIAYVELVPAPAGKPWDRYDEMEPEKIVEIASMIGYDIDEIIRYELENEKRERYLDVFANARAAQEETVVVRA